MSLDESHFLDQEAKEPLLSPQNSPIRRGKSFLTHGKVDEILTSADAECARGKFEFPTSRSLVGMYVLLSLVYIAYMMVSWLDISMRHKMLFPICRDYWGSWVLPGVWVMRGGCTCSILLFWLFPIFCSIILLLFFYRDLLQTRMYYTMLAHQVHLDFTNVTFFKAVSVRVMLVWCILCLSAYPLAGITSLKGILQTLPFWIPVASFGTMLYTQWDIETRLVSVAHLVQNDVEWAGNHVKRSFFLRDYIAERAFHKVKKEFDKQKPAPELTSGEYIKAIAEAAEQDHKQHLHDEKEHDEALKKRSNVTIFYAVSPWYWINNFLYCPCLVDTRAKNFHFWFQIYFVFTLLALLALLVLATLTVFTHLHMQEIITAPTWLVFHGLDIYKVPHAHHSASFVETATRSLGSGSSQWFQGQSAALRTENVALQAQDAVLQKQSKAQVAEVAALLAEVALLKVGVRRT